MSERPFPAHPDLNQLKRQAKELLRQIRRGEAPALAEFKQFCSKPLAPEKVKLADAQYVLARAHGIASWPRMILACRLTEGIWRDDVELVRLIISEHPHLLHEMARGTQKSNWGPPLSFAATVGRPRIVAMLRELGAADVQYAFDRACLTGHLDVARQLFEMGARPARDACMGPAETQNSEGLAFVLDRGAEISDRKGKRLGPVSLLLQTYSRNPTGKHKCLELFAGHGVALPDTPPMAVHRGRIDLLKKHLRAYPMMLNRTFSHEEIYPPELGCGKDHTYALHGTPLAGGTLLHLCVDNDEMEMAQWLLDHGADVNARAGIDADGFGGHTALFGCVVSQPYRVSLRKDDGFARFLLDRGADVNARASLRKELRFVKDITLHEYRDVTPLAWGEKFHDRDWVNRAAMKLIAERGGTQ